MLNQRRRDDAALSTKLADDPAHNRRCFVVADAVAVRAVIVQANRPYPALVAATDVAHLADEIRDQDGLSGAGDTVNPEKARVGLRGWRLDRQPCIPVVYPMNPLRGVGLVARHRFGVNLRGVGALEPVADLSLLCSYHGTQLSSWRQQHCRADSFGTVKMRNDIDSPLSCLATLLTVPLSPWMSLLPSLSTTAPIPGNKLNKLNLRCLTGKKNQDCPLVLGNLKVQPVDCASSYRPQHSGSDSAARGFAVGGCRCGCRQGS